MQKDPLAQVVTLPDGRSLGYAEFGNIRGKPVFHFHGVPGSRFEARLLARPAQELGAHLIAIDRPGIGLSTFQKDRQIVDWPKDVATLADELSIDRFAVEGFSGGGPYAAACAALLPKRIRACGLISSAGPSRGQAVTQKRLKVPLNPSPIQPLKKPNPHIWNGIASGCIDIAHASHFVEKKLVNMFTGGLDAKLCGDSSIQSIFAADFYEAFRQGPSGESYEDGLRYVPWNFHLESISSHVPTFLWHGELDTNVPCNVGRAICQAIKHCRATFYPTDGHISVLFCHGTEILRDLTQLEG